MGNWLNVLSSFIISGSISRFRRQLGMAAGATGLKLARGMHVEIATDVQVDVVVKVAVL